MKQHKLNFSRRGFLKASALGISAAAFGGPLVMRGSAASTVGSRKQRRFTLAARHLMLTRPQYRRLAARFDVVAIDPAPGGGPARLTWIRDAFRS